MTILYEYIIYKESKFLDEDTVRENRMGLRYTLDTLYRYFHNSLKSLILCYILRILKTYYLIYILDYKPNAETLKSYTFYYSKE